MGPIISLCPTGKGHRDTPGPEGLPTLLSIFCLSTLTLLGISQFFTHSDTRPVRHCAPIRDTSTSWAASSTVDKTIYQSGLFLATDWLVPLTAQTHTDRADRLGSWCTT